MIPLTSIFYFSVHEDYFQYLNHWKVFQICLLSFVIYFVLVHYVLMTWGQFKVDLV